MSGWRLIPTLFLTAWSPLLCKSEMLTSQLYLYYKGADAWECISRVILVLYGPTGDMEVRSLTHF